MPLDLQPLTDQVAHTEGVEASAKVLIEGFAAAVDAANTANNAKISEVTARMRASADSLASAVAAQPNPGVVG